MIPIRVIKAILAFLCSTNIYISRTNLNIGIIKMVQRNKGSSGSSCNRTVTSPTTNISEPVVEDMGRHFIKRLSRT